ncbi:4Fe-4S binding protein [Oscillibacter valericigenes]|uniref:thiamine pyrophosphate-dependent enzyme n=1 Tax=Oscillibacter valericigenes TaxID=351091 RepID=UPI001F37930E|nr:thiamine pyrophosphate-dependent enzyme [Oscillibacter valericigenes]MCF2664229.1 4Fe-4S binding protein [Oscillibacter valericigenes]
MEWTMTANAPGQVCLMQGNEAIVRGALEAGINFAASYPGSPSSQVLGMLGKVARERNFYAEWSTNETCAMEACIGASLANARSLCIVKQNGLLFAADAIHCGAQHGVKGGMVIVTSDDPSAHSSTNEFDSRYQAMSANIPMLEPTSMQETKDMVPYAFELSERTHQMVIIRLTTRVCHGRGNVVLGELPEKPHQMKQVGEWDRMVCVSYLRSAMLQKMDMLRQEFENCPYNHYAGPDHPKELIVAGGTGRLYGQEAIRRLGVGDRVGLLSLGTIWPLPEAYILRHLEGVEKVLTLEEVDPVLERNLQAIAGSHQMQITFSGREDGALPKIGELDPDNVAQAISLLTGAKLPEKKIASQEPLIERELTFCAGCPHRATFHILKKVLRQEKHPGAVIGDIGCYIMSGQAAGQYAFQACNCMGSGINLAEALGQLTHYGLDQKVVTVCGDSTFFHTILPGLVNATYHNANMLLMVLDNSATAMTGFQPHPATGITAMGDQVPPMDIQKVVEGIGCKAEVADPFDVKETEKTIRRLLNTPGMNVLIMRQPCATLMTKKKKRPVKVYVDQNMCLGDGCGCDKYCSRVWGCPGNTWDFKNNKAYIDPVTCVGCGVCAKLCPSGAIKVEGGEEA